MLGSVEYGKTNSLWLFILHIAYYAACVYESYLQQQSTWNNITIFGLIIYGFSIIALYYVIFRLGKIWTVKLIIGPRGYHVLKACLVFRYVKHPNYFLNVIPELVGIGIIFEAWHVLALLLPIYLIPLFNRIEQEEAVMKENFENYL